MLKLKKEPYSPAGPTPPPGRLAFTDQNQVVGLDFPAKGATGEFLHNPDGSIAWFRFGGRIHRRLS